MDNHFEPHIHAYWNQFLETLPADQRPDKFDAWPFGSGAAMADKLGALVAGGTKTATASLSWYYHEGGEAHPEIGDYNIILDGRGDPLCIVRVTALETVPFNQVSEEQAFLEGEGDRSLAYWREVHWDFFAAECQELGIEMHAEIAVLCEVFELVFNGS